MGDSARQLAAAAVDTDALNRMRARLPAQEELWLAVDQGAVAAYEQVRGEARMARLGRDTEAAEKAEKRLAEARGGLEATGAVRWVVRSRGRRAYRELLHSDTCRPRDADHEEVRRLTGQPNARAQYNADQWPYRLLELCCVEPAGVAAAEVREWVDDGRLSDGELERLVQAAQRVHVGDRIVDLGK